MKRRFISHPDQDGVELSPTNAMILLNYFRKPTFGAQTRSTQREREVAALIAQGRSNGEIADDLVVSKRTIKSHIANILSKLGFTNRAQIVRWAIETGLMKPTH